jgi:hypothetical protein
MVPRTCGPIAPEVHASAAGKSRISWENRPSCSEVNRLTSDALLGLYAPSRAVSWDPTQLCRSDGPNEARTVDSAPTFVSEVCDRGFACVPAQRWWPGMPSVQRMAAATDLDRADRLRGAQVSGAGARASDGSYTCGRMRERECRSHQYVAPAVLTRMLKQASHAGSICADCIAAG